MDAAIRDAYLETQVVTATPQRLRLMVIEQAIRRVHVAELALREGRREDATNALDKCRELFAELISGIQPDQSPVAKQVLGIYTFLFSALVEAQFSGDAGRLADIARVLDEERTTWLAVCEQMPDRPIAANSLTEELAPQRVQETWTPHFQSPVGGGNARMLSESLSLDA